MFWFPLYDVVKRQDWSVVLAAVLVIKKYRRPISTAEVLFFWTISFKIGAKIENKRTNISVRLTPQTDLFLSAPVCGGRCFVLLTVKISLFSCSLYLGNYFTRQTHKNFAFFPTMDRRRLPAPYFGY